MNQPKRKQNRLDGYDYASVGAYFITVCTKDRKKILWSSGESKNFQKPVGAIIGRPPMPYQLSEIGVQVQTAIDDIPQYYKNVRVDYYCIMPDHIHMIFVIFPPEDWSYDNDGRLIIAPTNKDHLADIKRSEINISNIVRQLKSIVSKQLGFSIWQKSFYDEIIRSREHYNAVRRYIADNPLRWEYDCGAADDFTAFFAESAE